MPLQSVKSCDSRCHVSTHVPLAASNAIHPVFGSEPRWFTTMGRDPVAVSLKNSGVWSRRWTWRSLSAGPTSNVDFDGVVCTLSPPPRLLANSTSTISRVPTITPTTPTIVARRVSDLATGMALLGCRVQRPYRVRRGQARPRRARPWGQSDRPASRRDAGFEVIYTGLFQTPEQVAETALQGGRRRRGPLRALRRPPHAVPAGRRGVHKRGLDDVIVFGGGIVPPADIATLKEKGVAEIFTPGASMVSITDWLEHASLSVLSRRYMPALNAALASRPPGMPASSSLRATPSPRRNIRPTDLTGH